MGFGAEPDAEGGAGGGGGPGHGDVHSLAGAFGGGAGGDFAGLVGGPAGFFDRFEALAAEDSFEGLGLGGGFVCQVEAGEYRELDGFAEKGWVAGADGRGEGAVHRQVRREGEVEGIAADGFRFGRGRGEAAFFAGQGDLGAGGKVLQLQ